MGKMRLLWLFPLVFAAWGCGPSAGDLYEVPRTTEIYFHKSDAEDGGPSDRWFELMRSGRMDSIGQAEVKILEPGKPWTKVEVTAGGKKGAIGWIEADHLGEKR